MSQLILLQTSIAKEQPKRIIKIKQNKNRQFFVFTSKMYTIMYCLKLYFLVHLLLFKMIGILSSLSGFRKPEFEESELELKDTEKKVQFSQCIEGRRIQAACYDLMDNTHNSRYLTGLLCKLNTIFNVKH